MRSRGVPWYLFGAQAVVIWGLPRLSADLDVTAQLPPKEIEDFVGAMSRAGFVSRIPDPRAHFEETRVLPFVHSATDVPLDVVVAGPGVEEEFLARSVESDHFGVTVPIISAEDLVTAKVFAGRPKDIEDVRGILLVRWQTLDLELIRQTLSLFEAALARSDLLPVFEQELARARERSPGEPER